jgi:hypothetical protein
MRAAPRAHRERLRDARVCQQRCPSVSRRTCVLCSGLAVKAVIRGGTASHTTSKYEPPSDCSGGGAFPSDATLPLPAWVVHEPRIANPVMRTHSAGGKQSYAKVRQARTSSLTTSAGTRTRRTPCCTAATHDTCTEFAHTCLNDEHYTGRLGSTLDT